MQEPFVHVIGRLRLYDILKQNIKKHTPGCFVSCVQTISRPYILAKIQIDTLLKIYNALPKPIRAEFYKMYKEARKRWDQGKKDESAAPIEFPVEKTSYRVWIRPGTPDVILYYDIMIKENYGKVPLENVKTIIDCGANIGLASAYLLCKYPNSRLIALEPDPINYKICCKNLEQFGSRVQVLQLALWGKPCRMTVKPDNIGTWASSVAPSDKDTVNTIAGIDMATLLVKYKIPAVDILKIDIEGAEEEVFSSCNLGWLDKVKCIQIECENIQTEDVFINAVSPMKFELSRFSEIMIAVNKNFKKK